MKALLSVALFALSSLAFAFDDDCEGTSGSTYVEACNLEKSVREMDKQLNSKYQEILTMYQKRKATASVKSLVDAQRAWIRYRDKVCTFEDKAFGGIVGISWIRCKARITETRLNELSEFDTN